MLKSIISKIINIIFLLLLSSCISNYPIRHYQLTNFTSADKLGAMGNVFDVDDLRGCFYMGKLDKWHLDRYAKNNNKEEGRIARFYDASIYHSTGGGRINSPTYNLKTEIIANPDIFHLIYAGPWVEIPNIKKKVRMFVYQEKGYLELDYHFATPDDFNVTIPYTPFSLNPNHPIPNRNDLCKMKWFITFGYNAQAHYDLSTEFKHKLRYYLTLFSVAIPKIYSGKVVDVESGEIIYNGNIFTGENSNIEHPVRLLKYNGKFNGDGLWNNTNSIK